MQFRRIFGLKSDGKERAIGSTDDGRLKVEADISGGLDTAGLATELTLEDIKTATEALAVATPDTAAGDLASMSADLATVQADIALMKADLAAILAILES